MLREDNKGVPGLNDCSYWFCEVIGILERRQLQVDITLERQGSECRENRKKLRGINNCNTEQ